jgi:hypothetical protein
MDKYITPDSYRKTVMIPVRISNGKVTFYYGGNLPEMRDDVIGDLIVPSSAIKDPDILKKLSQMAEQQVFPSGTSLLIEFHPKQSDIKDVNIVNHFKDTFQRHRIEQSMDKIFWIDYKFSEVILQEPLRICTRGTKLPVLALCKCYIPFLKEDARSLNHAYTLMSQVFESSRMSHTGNVFKRVYFKDVNGKWYPLENKRNSIQEYEEREKFVKKEPSKQLNLLWPADVNRE